MESFSTEEKENNLVPDFGNAALDYGKYRHGFPSRFFNEVKLKGIGLNSQKILDIGTGTGTLARNFASAGCEVTAIDRSDKMLEQAQEISIKNKLIIHFKVAEADKTLEESCSFDVVSAGQCWHLLGSQKVIEEVKRVLKPDGFFLIAHFDWLPLNGSVSKLSEELIAKHNPKWNMTGGTGFYPQWVTDLSEDCFDDIETMTFDTYESYSQEAWRGRIRASIGVSASLSKEQVIEFDKEHEFLLRKNFPKDMLSIKHRCFFITAKYKKL